MVRRADRAAVVGCDLDAHAHAPRLLLSRGRTHGEEAVPAGEALEQCFREYGFWRWRAQRRAEDALDAAGAADALPRVALSAMAAHILKARIECHDHAAVVEMLRSAQYAGAILPAYRPKRAPNSLARLAAP